MATVKAIVRTTKKNSEVNIRFRLSDGRNVQLFHNSEIKVNVDLWDSKGDCIKKRALCSDNIRFNINKAVADRKNLILSIYNAHKSDGLTGKHLELLINEVLSPSKDNEDNKDDFFTLTGSFISNNNYSKNRERGYALLFRLLLRYEMFVQKVFDKNFSLDIQKIDASRLEDIISFIKNEYILSNDYPSVFEEIEKTMRTMAKHGRYKKPSLRGNNSQCAILNLFRTFLNWCVRKGFLSKNPFQECSESIKEQYGTPYYLTLEERNHIADFDLSNYPHLAIQRDIFIFQCLIGCRVSDLLKMTNNNIINEAVEYIPCKTRNKSLNVVRVPLNERAKSIVAKYQGKDSKGRLFPFLSVLYYNKNIKEIFKICGIIRLVTVLNPTTGEEEKRPINEIASSHMARRTFVGNLYKKVKDPNLVGSLSGHAEGSKAFARYREIDEEMKKEVVSLIE